MATTSVNVLVDGSWVSALMSDTPGSTLTFATRGARVDDPLTPLAAPTGTPRSGGVDYAVGLADVPRSANELDWTQHGTSGASGGSGLFRPGF